MHNLKSHFQQDFLAYCTRPVSVHLAMVSVGCSFNSFSNFLFSLKQQQNLMKSVFSCIHFSLWPYPPKIIIFFKFYTGKLYGLTATVKVHWVQWCRQNCDLRIINAWKHAFSAVPKTSPWHWKLCAHYAHYVVLGSRCKMASSHKVTNLEKIPVWISKDKAPMPVVGPLFISSLLFHLSWTLLDVWRFSLFLSVYSSFHNRLNLIREPACYWVFYFPNLSLFVLS